MDVNITEIKDLIEFAKVTGLSREPTYQAQYTAHSTCTIHILRLFIASLSFKSDH